MCTLVVLSAKLWPFTNCKRATETMSSGGVKENEITLIGSKNEYRNKIQSESQAIGFIC